MLHYIIQGFPTDLILNWEVVWKFSFYMIMKTQVSANIWKVALATPL